MAKYSPKHQDRSARSSRPELSQSIREPNPKRPKKTKNQPPRRSARRLLSRMKRIATKLRVPQWAVTAWKFPQRIQNPRHRRLFWVGVGVGSGAIALSVSWFILDRSLPDTSDIATFERDGTLTIKASDGTILQQLGPATRDKLTIQQIPKPLIQAFIASEDRRFYQHNGVDYQGIVRAMASNMLAREVVQGGSTITQQVARIVFLNQERSIGRKVREAMLAQKIEREMSKQQILERYLNLVYLGSGAYGVADAAWVYFSKPVNKLTLSEAATIAGLPPAPSLYSPLVNVEAAQKRRNLVLERMQNAKFITAAEAKAASDSQLAVKPSAPKRLYSETPYFTSYIQKQLPQYVSQEALELGGITVETTLNSKWQKAADQAIKDAIELDGPAQGFEQAALVAIDPRNGEVKAMVGGLDFGKSQFNRATQAQRQPGSTFKALVYTTAIAAGFAPTDGYLDARYTVDGYRPQNFGKTYRGWVSMIDALTYSVNVVAVKVLIDVGFEPTIKLAHQMGIKSELQPTYSLALGSSEVNLLELTSAYGTLAAKGKHVETHGIRRIVNRRGKVLYNADFKSKQVVDKGTASIVTWMLESVVNSGTGQPAQLGRPVAGKTGTSEQARDLWFIGYIPQVVGGVWLGNDDNYPTWGSSSTAAYTWHEFMAKVIVGMPVEKFPEVPKLEGRKGMIKAKPVTPKYAYSGGTEPEGKSEQDYGHEDSASDYNSGSESGSESESYSSGGESDDYYQPQSYEQDSSGQADSWSEEAPPSDSEPAAEEAPTPPSESEPATEEAPAPPSELEPVL